MDHKSGRYHNDYSPRYQKPYDIYEKAKQHMKKIRQERDAEEKNRRNPDSQEE